LQCCNAAMLQYCNAAMPTLQLPAISKWANWSAKQNLLHRKQRQHQSKATSMPSKAMSMSNEREFIRSTSPSRLILELSLGDSMELSSRANRLGMGDRQKQSRGLDQRGRNVLWLWIRPVACPGHGFSWPIQR
jgi:hypothetical protein